MIINYLSPQVIRFLKDSKVHKNVKVYGVDMNPKAAGKYFAFEEYKINAEQTKNPCNADKEVFFSDIKILLS